MMIQVLLVSASVADFLQFLEIRQNKGILSLNVLLTIHQKVLSLLQLDLTLKFDHHFLVHACIFPIG